MFRLLEELEHKSSTLPCLSRPEEMVADRLLLPSRILLCSKPCQHLPNPKQPHPPLIHTCKERKAIRCAERMIRRSGVSREEVVSSLVSTYSNCGSNDSVFDLLIRTYVQARKLREAHEAFTLLRSKGYTVSIDACNALITTFLGVEF
ncbi:hypothetical protein F2Q70_00007463 [Brassica cretica]|uniref:Pentacotripeptide-repeat region of PRORP domain-containing protein n=1 Tax=Brassica cretica TaxID=69181 RepID=A0A8S9M8F5_BRACR|nr:hypothetical protein F2Q70_00007463 [Brassica cretica]